MYLAVTKCKILAYRTEPCKGTNSHHGYQKEKPAFGQMHETLAKLGVHEVHQEAGEEYTHAVDHDRDWYCQRHQQQAGDGMPEQQPSREYRQCEQSSHRSQSTARLCNEQVVAGKPNHVTGQENRNIAPAKERRSHL